MCEYVHMEEKLINDGEVALDIKTEKPKIQTQTSIIFPPIDAKYEVTTNKNGTIFITKIY